MSGRSELLIVLALDFNVILAVYPAVYLYSRSIDPYAAMLEGELADPKKRKTRAKVTILDDLDGDDEDRDTNASIDEDLDEDAVKPKKVKVGESPPAHHSTSYDHLMVVEISSIELEEGEE
jgi:hypothetical protein